MNKIDMIKWLIKKLVETDMNSKMAWRYAGALDAIMVLDGRFERGHVFEFKTFTKGTGLFAWLNTRTESYPELILRYAIECYINPPKNDKNAIDI